MPNTDEKELDKDLTMLQGGPEDPPAKSALDQEWDNIMSTAKGPETPGDSPFKNQADVDTYISGIQADSEVLRSLTPGTRDADLDVGRSIFETTNDVRSRNQNSAIKGLKAFGGGLLQGGLVALEQVGYIADIDTYTNIFTEADDYSGNAWSTLMSEAQEGVGESEAFKIYEDDADQNSINSQIFKWTSLQAAMSSAVGFGVTGLGAAKLVSALGSVGKFSKIAELTDIAMGNIKGVAIGKATKNAYKATAAGVDLAEAGIAAGMKGVTKAFVGPLATSSMTNFYMGQLMAVDTFNASMQALDGLVGKPKADGTILTKSEAQRLANNEAGDVVTLNMALALTGYIKFGGIFKRQNRFKSMVQDPTTFWQAKQLVKTGSPTAFVENVYQEMIQMEQIHDTQMAAGVDTEDTDYSGDYWNRITQLALSNRAVHAGALGVIGGPIQFAIIQKPMMGDQLKSQKNAFDKQQESRGWHAKLAQNNFEIFRKFESNTTDALKAGKISDAVLNDDISVINEIVKTHTWGTIESLKHDMEQVKKMTPEEAAQSDNKYGEDYIEVADKVLETASKVQQYASGLGNIVNKDGIVFTRVVYDRVAQEYNTVAKEVGVLREKLIADAVTNLGKDVIIDFDEKGKPFIDRDPNRFEGKSSTQEFKMREAEMKDQRALDTHFKYNIEYTNFLDKVKDLKKYKKFSEELGQQYDDMISPEGQAKFTSLQRTAMKNAPEAAKKANLDDIETEDAKTRSTGFMSYTELLESKPPLTVQELRDLNDKYSSEVSETPNERAVAKDTSFSSRDSKGDVRVWTPGDLTRSTDGRHFVVDSQNESNSSFGETGTTMPIVYEVVQNKEGVFVKKKGALKVVLRDNSLLRPEVQQSTYSKGKYFYRGTKWAPYVNIDYMLRPNHYQTQSSRSEFASKGHLRSVNISGRMMKLPEFSWTQAYNMHLLNEPFEGEYGIVYKENIVGPNETYIDVYKRVPGQEDLLLTRLDKDYNLGHGDLLSLIRTNKGEVTGKVVEHFSSRYNFNKKIDENGNSIKSPASTLKSLPNHFKLNGELVFMSKKGERAVPQTKVARGTDGVVHLSTIDVQMPSGLFKTFDIPYASVRPGDVAVLILSPDGTHLIPLMLGSQTLASMAPTAEGSSIVETYAMQHQKAIEDFMDAQGMDEQAIDDAVTKDMDENKIPESRWDIEFAKAKRQWAFERSNANKEKSLYKLLEKSVYQNVRGRFDKYQLEGRVNGKNIIEKTASGKSNILAENHFSLDLDVGEDGRFTPMIKVRKGEYQLRTDKDPGYVVPDRTNWEYIKYSEDSYRYLEVLGQQYKRAPIDTLSNENQTTGKEAIQEVSDFIENEGLTTDINPTNPIIGSSATLTVDGEAYADMSATAAILHTSKVQAKFKKYIKDSASLKEVSWDKSEKLLSSFNDTMEEVLTEEGGFLSDLMGANSESEIKDYVNAFIDRLGIMQDYHARTMLTEALENVPESRLEEYNNLIESNRAKGITAYTEYIAKVVMALSDINVKVNSGELKLRATQTFIKANDATGKYTQPENFEFVTGALVYHDVHGEVKYKYTIKAGKNAGMYKVQKISDNKIFEVYPKDTFRHGKDLMEISKVKKLMHKFKPESNQYKALATTLQGLEATFAKKKAYWDGTANQDGTNTTTNTNSGKSLKDAFQRSIGSLSNITLVESVATTERSDAMADYLNELASLDEERASSENIGVPVTTEFLQKVDNVYKKFPYSDADLSNLLNVTEGLISKGVNVNRNKIHASYIEGAIEFRRMLFSRRDHTRSVLGSYKVWSAAKEKYRKWPINLVGLTKLGDAEATTAPLTVGTAAGYLFSVAKITQNVIVGEVELRGELYADAVSTPKVNNPASKMSGKELSDILQSNVDIISPFKNNKPVTWQDEYDAYYNTETDTMLRRVTSLLKPTPTSNDLLRSASTIGTKSDLLWRDYFDGTKIKFDPKYGFSNKANFDTYLQSLADVKKYFTDTNQTVIAKDIVLYDDKNRAGGTVDLLTYDDKGKFRIYDMKTMRKNKFTEIGVDGKPIYQTPFKKGDISDESYWQKQMSLYRIMLFNTHGILAESSVTVLASQVTYKAKDISSSNTVFLQRLELEALDSVKTIEGDTVRMGEGPKIKPVEPSVGKFTNASTFTTIDAPIIPGTLHLVDVGFIQKFQTVEGAYYAHRLNFGEEGRYTKDGKFTDEALGIIDELTKAKGEDAEAIGNKIQVEDTGRWSIAARQEVLATLLKDAVEQNHPNAEDFKAADFSGVVNKSIDGINYKDALETSQEYVTVGNKPNPPSPKTVVTPKESPTVTDDDSIAMVRPEEVFSDEVQEVASLHTLPEFMPEDIVDLLDDPMRSHDIENFFTVIATAHAMGDSLESIYNELRNLPPFKRGENTQNTQEAFDTEVASIRKMLPQVPIEIVQDTVEMVKRYGVKSIGSFDKGVRYLVNNAVSGTGYHETFHAVAGLYLTSEEKSKIAKEEGYDSWNMALEEKLAENFENYARSYVKPSFGQRVINFFKKLLSWSKEVKSPKYVESVYERIVTGEFSKSPYLNWENNLKSFTTLDGFQKDISAKNNVLLQRLMKSGRIKIVC